MPKHMTWREAELLLQQPPKPTVPTGPSREALRGMLNAHQYTRAPNGSIQPHASAGASSSSDGPRPAEADPHVPGVPETSPPQTRQPPQHPGDKDAHKQRMADNPYQETQRRPQQPKKPDSHPAAAAARHNTHRSSPERPHNNKANPQGRETKNGQPQPRTTRGRHNHRRALHNRPATKP